MKIDVKITLYGCDDATIVRMKMTESQFNFLTELARMTVEASSYGCMPTMQVEEIRHDEK